MDSVGKVSSSSWGSTLFGVLPQSRPVLAFPRHPGLSRGLVPAFAESAGPALGDRVPVYTNEVYGQTDAVLRIQAEAGVGAINL